MCDPTPGDQVASASPRFDEQDRFRARASMVLFVFVLWFLLIVGRMAQFMVFRRDQEMSAMTRESVVYGQIPALRGRLLDRDGRVLAWSERDMRLLWTPPADPEKAEESAERIRRALPWLAWPEITLESGDEPPAPILLADRLGPEEVLEVKRKRLPGLSVEPHVERRRVGNSAATHWRIGTVRWENGVSVGVSGLELAHDALLAGQPGVFRVVVDKHGRWVAETWTVVQPMRPGYDVHVTSFTVGR